MASAPTFVEQHSIPRGNGLIDNLTDLSFQRMLTPRILKLLYGIHLLAGLVGAIWFVFSGFQTSTPNGLLALIMALAGMVMWVVYCRIVVEMLAAFFSAVQVITNSQR